MLIFFLKNIDYVKRIIRNRIKTKEDDDHLNLEFHFLIPIFKNNSNLLFSLMIINEGDNRILDSNYINLPLRGY